MVYELLPERSRTPYICDFLFKICVRFLVCAATYLASVLYDLDALAQTILTIFLRCPGREGVNSLFPEMILLPRWFPLHTSRMWSYCRTVYMPMSYLYGKRYQGPVTEVVKELREGVRLACRC